MNSKQKSKNFNYNASDLISGITYSSDKGLKTGYEKSKEIKSNEERKKNEKKLDE